MQKGYPSQISGCRLYDAFCFDMIDLPIDSCAAQIDLSHLDSSGLVFQRHFRSEFAWREVTQG